MAARSQPQPSGEVLFTFPRAEICADLANQLQQAVIGMRGQDRHILVPADPVEYLVQILNLGSVDPTPFLRLLFWFQAADFIRAADFAQHLLDLSVAGGDLTLIGLPIFHGLPEREEVLFGPGAAQ